MKKHFICFLLILALGLSAAAPGHAGANPALIPAGQDLKALIDYRDTGLAKRIIFQGKGYTILLFAFRQGQELQAHTIPIDAFVQVLEGKARVLIDGREQEVRAGEMIVLPGNLSHALRADEDFKMLLVK